MTPPGQDGPASNYIWLTCHHHIYRFLPDLSPVGASRAGSAGLLPGRPVWLGQLAVAFRVLNKRALDHTNVYGQRSCRASGVQSRPENASH